MAARLEAQYIVLAKQQYLEREQQRLSAAKSVTESSGSASGGGGCAECFQRQRLAAACRIHFACAACDSCRLDLRAHVLPAFHQDVLCERQRARARERERERERER